ncbi:MAG: mercuric ion transporter MerT [Gemmatimonadaceae bacterium]
MLDTPRQSDKPLSSSDRSGVALFAGGLAALLASACCLGPLVLLMLGISGAWIGNLTALEPYRPLFIGIAIATLYFAHRRIFRQAAECEPGEICAVPAVNRAYRILFWMAVALLAIALLFPFVAPFFY